MLSGLAVSLTFWLLLGIGAVIVRELVREDPS